MKTVKLWVLTFFPEFISLTSQHWASLFYCNVQLKLRFTVAVFNPVCYSKLLFTVCYWLSVFHMYVWEKTFELETLVIRIKISRGSSSLEVSSSCLEILTWLQVTAVCSFTPLGSLKHNRCITEICYCYVFYLSYLLRITETSNFSV